MAAAALKARKASEDLEKPANEGVITQEKREKLLGKWRRFYVEKVTLGVLNKRKYYRGWLWKEGEVGLFSKPWSLRFFLLKGPLLCYFVEDDPSEQCKGVILLTDSIVERVREASAPTGHVLRVTSPRPRHAGLLGDTAVFQLACETPKLMKDWFERMVVYTGQLQREARSSAVSQPEGHEDPSDHESRGWIRRRVSEATTDSEPGLEHPSDIKKEHEVKKGHGIKHNVPIPSKRFAMLASVVACQSFESSKVAVVECAAAHFFSKEQVDQLVAIASFEDSQAQIASVLKPRTVPSAAPQSQPLAPELTEVSKSGFERLCKLILRENFTEGRLQLINEAQTDHYFTSKQIARLVDHVEYSDQKRALAMRLHPRCVDPHNYFIVFRGLDFDADVYELSQYLLAKS